jgi:hypothetical protein
VARWRLPAGYVARPAYVAEQRKANERANAAADAIKLAPQPPKTSKAPRKGHATKYPGVPALFRACGLPEPVAECPFTPLRGWRFDFAWPGLRIALEVDGGLFSGGAHTRGAALLQEYDKLNAAASLGWRIFYCTPRQLKHMPAVMERALLDAIVHAGVEARIRPSTYEAAARRLAELRGEPFPDRPP